MIKWHSLPLLSCQPFSYGQTSLLQRSCISNAQATSHQWHRKWCFCPHWWILLGRDLNGLLTYCGSKTFKISWVCCMKLKIFTHSFFSPLFSLILPSVYVVLCPYLKVSLPNYDHSQIHLMYSYQRLIMSQAPETTAIDVVTTPMKDIDKLVTGKGCVLN